MSSYGRLREENALIGDDADGVAVDPCKSRHQCGAIILLELVEAVCNKHARRTITCAMHPSTAAHCPECGRSVGTSEAAR